MEPLLTRLGLDLALDPERAIVYGALAAARILPIFAIAPFFGGRAVPAPVRLGVAVAFVALVFPAITAAAPAPSSLGPLVLAGLLAREVLLGSLLGFLAAIPFWAAEAAGRLVDTARGANNQELFVPQLGYTASPLGDFATQLAIVVFFAVDGHLVLLRALAASYEAVPVWGLPATGAVAGAAESALALRATSHLVLVALGLAAPVLATMLLADVALGLVNRVAPSVQVFFLGMPAKAVLGVLVFMLALTGLVTALRGEMGLMLRHVTDAIRIL